MDEMRIKLAGVWVVVMLIYLLGDVLRMYAGGVTPGELMGQKAAPWMWMLISVIMLVPILMIFFTLTTPQGISRWANIIAAAAFLLFNLFGLPTYPLLFDKFLLAVSLVFNVVTIWYAWHWI